MFRTCSRVVLMCTLLLTVGVPGHSAARASVADGEGVLAWFDGQWIDLSEGWGGAEACSTDGVTATCYRSEAEMDRAARASMASMAIVPLASCASSLRLYRSTSYGGAVLQLTTRGVYLNLSAYGFDNDTSSYKVGACASYFYDGANGGSPLYPGGTGANASATSMLTGWDNRVSSVYIA